MDGREVVTVEVVTPASSGQDAACDLGPVRAILGTFDAMSRVVVVPSERTSGLARVLDRDDAMRFKDGGEG